MTETAYEMVDFARWGEDRKDQISLRLWDAMSVAPPFFEFTATTHLPLLGPRSASPRHRQSSLPITISSCWDSPALLVERTFLGPKNTI